MSPESIGSVISEVSSVFGHVYRSILSSPSGVFVFLVATPARAGSLARQASLLTELGLNLLLSYMFNISEDLAMALMIYEAKEGYFQKAIEALRRGGAVVREAYYLKVIEKLQ